MRNDTKPRKPRRRVRLVDGTTSSPIYVPEVGTFHPTIDRIEIASSIDEKELRRKLPIDELEADSHNFQIIQPEKPIPYVASIITVTCTPHADPLRLLLHCKSALGSYTVCHVELAYDIPTASAIIARQKLRWLVAHIRKPHHARRQVRVVGHEWSKSEEGHLSHATTYYEHRKSTVSLKLYTRKEKRLNGTFGDPCVRLEWTLRRAAIKRYLGGNKLEHLIDFDLNGYLLNHLHLEEVDYDRLGWLLTDGKAGINWDKVENAKSDLIRKIELNRPRRAAFQYLRVQSYGDKRTPGNHHFVEWVWTTSPAQIRGHLLQLLDEHEKEGRAGQRRIPLTRYQIDRCFKPIHLRKENDTL